MEQQVEKRVIVVDTEENKKYVLPGNYDAAFIMGGTIERVRQKMVKNNGKPIYGKYLIFRYSEDKYNELTKEGVKDGLMYIIFKERYDSIFGGLYNRNIGNNA